MCIDFQVCGCFTFFLRLDGYDLLLFSQASKGELFTRPKHLNLNLTQLDYWVFNCSFATFQADHSRYHNSHAHHLRHQPKEHNSVPNSPNETDLGRGGRSSGPNSAHTSPVGGTRKDHTPIQVGLISYYIF